MTTTYLTLTDAAARIGRHRRTLMRWANAGRIPGAKMTPSGQWLIPEQWVDELGHIKSH